MASNTTRRSEQLKRVCDFVQGIHQRVPYYRVPDTRSTDSPPETKPPSSQPLPGKFDAEALRDWEDEGGAQRQLELRLKPDR